MRRDLLDRPPPLSRATARPSLADRFRTAHLALAAVHLAQAFLVLAVAGGVVIDVTHRVGPADRSLVGVSVGAAMAAYFVAAAVHHGLSATALHGFYEADLRRGRNRIRWAEFAVSAPTLMVLIALYTGVTDVTALVVVAAASIATICCGSMQETLNPATRRSTTMVPFWAGVLASVVPWAIVGGRLIGSSETPQFALSIFLSLFILWASFGANQWLQYHQTGAWADHLHAERTYLVLSLVAKSALAWQIVAGVRLT